MNKAAFLVELAEGLRRIPLEEREEALQYYREFFEESGRDEKEVAKELGDPKKIAKQLAAEFNIQQIEVDTAPTPRKGFRVLGTVLLSIFAAPIALPIAIALAAVVLALFISLAVVMLTLFVTAIVLVIGGIGSFLLGLTVVPTHLATAAFAVGTGLFLTGLGTLGVYGISWVAKKLLQGVVKRTKQGLARGNRYETNN